MTAFGFLCTMAVLCFGTVAGPEWPRFRGPDGSGISTDAAVPVQWTDRNLIWKAGIPGTGHSSPIVWHSRIFVQSASADGSERLLVCLDASSGNILWTRAHRGSPARKHDRNTLASSTPATDGERVYALFWDGADITVAAYDFMGSLVWIQNLGRFTGEHGAGASPIVFGDSVIINNDQDGTAELVALNSSTGRVRWRAKRPAFVACYSTPIIIRRASDAAELVAGSTAGLTGYDPGTGRELWNWKWSFAAKALRTVASPVYGMGHIFLNSGDGGGARHAVAVRLEGSGDATRPTLAWENRRTLPYVPSMLVTDGHLYWVNDVGVAGCQKVETGESLWTNRLGGSFTASPVLAGNTIFAVNEDGDVYVFRAATRFDLLGMNSIGEPVRATPAILGNRILIRGAAHLFCYGNPD